MKRISSDYTAMDLYITLAYRALIVHNQHNTRRHGNIHVPIVKNNQTSQLAAA